MRVGGATEAMNMLAQPVRGGSQHNDARREPKPTIKAEKDVLRGYVEHMVNETLTDRQKRTPGKTRLPRSGQGAGAKRASVQAKKDAAVVEPCEQVTAGRSMRGSAGINQVARRALGLKSGR